MLLATFYGLRDLGAKNSIMHHGLVYVTAGAWSGHVFAALPTGCRTFALRKKRYLGQLSTVGWAHGPVGQGCGRTRSTSHALSVRRSRRLLRLGTCSATPFSTPLLSVSYVTSTPQCGMIGGSSTRSHLNLPMYLTPAGLLPLSRISGWTLRTTRRIRSRLFAPRSCSQRSIRCGSMGVLLTVPILRMVRTMISASRTVTTCWKPSQP